MRRLLLSFSTHRAAGGCFVCGEPPFIRPPALCGAEKGPFCGPPSRGAAQQAGRLCGRPFWSTPRPAWKPGGRLCNGPPRRAGAIAPGHAQPVLSSAWKEGRAAPADEPSGEAAAPPPGPGRPALAGPKAGRGAQGTPRQRRPTSRSWRASRRSGRTRGSRPEGGKGPKRPWGLLALRGRCPFTGSPRRGARLHGLSKAPSILPAREVGRGRHRG